MIAVFIADKVSRYIAGGMKPETAARFTRGELLAIYRRNHYSPDKSGAFQITPLPENIYGPARESYTGNSGKPCGKIRGSCRGDRPGEKEGAH
jgi:hypothetical protein